MIACQPTGSLGRGNVPTLGVPTSFPPICEPFDSAGLVDGRWGGILRGPAPGDEGMDQLLLSKGSTANSTVVMLQE